MALVGRSLDEDQADHVVVIELTGKSSMCDFMAIASGRSTRHVGALAENLRERLKAAGVPGVEIEGMPHCDWVLIDAGDVIIHLFRPEVRAFYNLEKMWGVDSPVPERVQPVEAEPVSPDDDFEDGDLEDGDDLDDDIEDSDLPE